MIDLQHIKNIEAAAYPQSFQQIQDCQTIADLEDYCEGSAKALQWPTGYCLVTDDEIVDLAVTSPLSIKEMRSVVKWLKGQFGNVIVHLDARKTTSWRLIKFAAKRGWIQVISESAWLWDDEEYIEMEVKFF